MATDSSNSEAHAPAELVTAEERRFTEDMRASRASGKAAEAVLRTDDRVLARITDGIYRQPSSALRELISNAYDADATEVYIETDAPRFSQIMVRDNGRGMDEAALSRMIHHIGGSSKRTTLGAGLGVTDPSDSSLSPGGRRLIGKIGIGLFSVSQLTSHFQIITKIKGKDYRLFADVILKTYSEENGGEPSDGRYETGRVRVISVPADDLDSQGTQIILQELHPRARDILRSRERWERYIEQQAVPEDERDPLVSAPAYHSGFLAREPDPADGELIFRFNPELPWERSDTPLARFEKLHGALASQVGSTTERPDLAKTLDTYLGTLWTLSLSAPLEYLHKHPFDLGAPDGVGAFRLSSGRGRAVPIELSGGKTIRQVAGLAASSKAPAGGFKVFVDEVELRRPVTFEWWPSERQAIGHPLMFIGAYKPDLSGVPSEMRGGDLEFEAYLFWNSKIVPKENNGVLVRINGASGALFDDTFMKYQVSEQTRLRQITAEIFVSRGLDAALNIDRESFNFAHPHYVLLSNWLHRSLRQLTNTHKALSQEIRDREAEAEQAVSADRLGEFASRTWRNARREAADRPPPIEVVATPSEAAARRREGVIAFDRRQMGAATPPAGKKARQGAAERERKLKAVATILDGFGVLDDMAYEDQHRLLNAILAVFFDDAQS
jgi:hypothetical protein